MEIEYTPRFQRSFKKLSSELQLIAWRKIEIFSRAQFHPALKTHKLTVDELWAFSVDYKNRVIFQFYDGRIILINIGDHSIYRKV